jgi:ribose transport system substrate-binding protein
MTSMQTKERSMMLHEANPLRGRRRPVAAFGLALLVLASLVAAGCGSSGGGSGEVKLGLSINGAPIPFYETLRESAEATAKKEGVDLRVVTPTTPEEQNHSVETLLTQQIDVLGLAPIDASAVVPAVEQANSKDVPVITVDETADGGEIYTYIASPNEHGGELAGEWLAEELKSGDQLGLMEGEGGSSTNAARMDGLRKALKGTGIKIVASAYGDWVTDKAFQEARDLVSGNPNLSAIFALNDAMGIGVAQAVDQSGKKSQIKIIGYNGDEIAFEAIKEGTMDATVAQDPTKMGELLIENAIAANEGEEAPEAQIETPVKVVDTSNISSVH